MKKLLFIIAAFLCFAWQTPDTFAAAIKTNDQVNDCPSPTNLKGEPSINSIAITWTPAGNEKQWFVRYKKEKTGAPIFDTITVSGEPKYVIENLEANTVYVVQVFVPCGDGTNSQYDQIILGTLSGDGDCPAPEKIVIENVKARKAVISWEPKNNEKQWQVGFTTKADLKEGKLNIKYIIVDKPRAELDLEPQLDYYVEVHAICANGNPSSMFGDITFSTPEPCMSPYNFKANASDTKAKLTWTQPDDTKAWEINYKADKDTEWISDTVYQPSIELTNLNFKTKYNARLRSLCMEDEFSGWISIDFSTTNYECLPPEKLGFTEISVSGATAVWMAANFETEWILQYKNMEDEEYGDNINVSDTTAYTFTGLKENTTYDVRIRSACNEERVSDWVVGKFTTSIPAPDTCDAPTDVKVDSITKNSAVVTWSQAEGTANEWEVRYRKDGATEWDGTLTVYETKATLTELTPETAYEVDVTAHCVNGVNSDPTAPVPFKTIPDAVNDYVLNSSINLFPNPTTGVITCNVKDLNVERVEVYDVYGKLLKTFNTNESVIRIDASSFANGMYFVRICTEQGSAHKAFIKK